MGKKIHLNIGGMTCVNCQNKIENALNKAYGVKHVNVSYAKAAAEIEFDDEKISPERIKKIIEKLDYKVLSQKDASAPDAAYAIGFVAIILVLFYLLQSLGILGLLSPDRLAESGMGYGMLFIIGIISSFHCVAMCGGIGLSQSISQKGDYKTLARPLSYNLGRVCSYTIIGLVLGIVGSLFGGKTGFSISYSVQGVIKLIIGLLMVIAGINMLGIVPWLRKFSIHMPVAVSKYIAGKGEANRGPFIIGLLNGLMPCGPLQAMWLVALATQSPVKGALSMLAFSLGTVPLMLGFGSVVSLLGKKFTSQIFRLGAIIVAVMGLAMMSQGGNLLGVMPVVNPNSFAFDSYAIGSGIQVNGIRNDNSQTVGQNETSSNFNADDVVDAQTGKTAIGNAGNVANSQADGEVQIIKSTLELGSYPDITVKAGTPVKWTIEVPEGALTGCNAVMVIQEYGIEHRFDFGENVIEFTPDKPGLVPYSCWMGMIYGSINVVE